MVCLWVCSSKWIKKPYNSIYVINDRGELHSRYDKRYCSYSEIENWYSAGQEPTTIEIDGLKFGFALCIEIQFPEIFLEYEKLGVECVCVSAYSDSEMFGIQSQGHAACNNYWISLSVPKNTSSKLASQLIGSDGSIISRCENSTSDVIHAKVSPTDKQWEIPCQKARPWRKIARKSKYEMC